VRGRLRAERTFQLDTQSEKKNGFFFLFFFLSSFFCLRGVWGAHENARCCALNATRIARAQSLR
jgi:hypothetical protein